MHGHAEPRRFRQQCGELVPADVAIAPGQRQHEVRLRDEGAEASGQVRLEPHRQHPAERAWYLTEPGRQIRPDLDVDHDVAGSGQHAQCRAQRGEPGCRIGACAGHEQARLAGVGVIIAGRGADRAERELRRCRLPGQRGAPLPELLSAVGLARGTPLPRRVVRDGELRRHPVIASRRQQQERGDVEFIGCAA